MSTYLYTFDQPPTLCDVASLFAPVREFGAGDVISATRPQAVEKDQLDQIAEHFEAYRQSLLGFLRSRVSSPEQAEDLLQQVFLKLLTRSDWNEIRNPEAYLRTTARHVLTDFYRSQGARDHGIVLEYQEFSDADETWSPGDSLRTREFMNRFSGVLDSLSPQVRNAFVLSRVYGYTYAEIGQKLSISPRTVEKHVAKGLAWCFNNLSEASDGSEEVS